MDPELKKRVLVVDDEAHVRAVLSRALMIDGYEALGAANGEEAVEKLSQGRFDLVILDLKMPGMSGLDVLDKLHAEHPETIVIMLTGVADNESIESRSLEGGAYAFLTKPCSLEELLVISREALATGRVSSVADQS